MKKTKVFVAFLIALMMVMTAVLSACQHTHSFVSGWTSDAENHWHVAACEHHEEISGKEAHSWGDDNVCTVCHRNKSDVGIVYDTSLVDLDDYQSYLVSELGTVKTLLTVNSEKDAAVATVYNDGVAAINAATSVGGARLAYETAKAGMMECLDAANGVKDLTGLTTAQKTELLGTLEAYAVRTGMTGITLFEDGGYVMYDPSITTGAEQYITGYGWGTLAEGSITADLASEANALWKRYYHTYNVTNPGTVNALNDTGSEVSDFQSYIAAGFYTTFMNSTKNGYEWVPELAVGNPIAVDGTNDAGQATKWKIELRKDLTYNTLGSRAATYNNRPVAIEDFITPFKLLLNQANGYVRGTELANSTGASAIVGAKSYFKSTKNAEKGILDDEDYSFSGVGVRVYKTDADTDNEKWWFEFELGAPVTMFFARYYMTSSLYTPVPAAFIEEVGVDTYLGYNNDKSTTPKDNSLSLGAYTIEEWRDTEIVYKKNPNYVHAANKYQIAGIHFAILPGAEEDTQLVFNEFLKGNLHAAGIPSTRLEEFRNDERTRYSGGSSCFKLNVNALDQETWIQLFGENGSVEQTDKDSYWDVEPALNNSFFRQALSYSLDRDSFAYIKGCTSSVDFLSSNYMSDPENGLFYDAQPAHKKAIESLLKGATETNGYSLELARDYFKMALAELEASGAYTRGTKENPTIIHLEVAWMYTAHNEAYHKYIKQYWETAFNDDSVTGGCYKLSVDFWVGTKWSDVYYNKMLVGQYDIGFGSISGNTLDPLSFMNILSTNPIIAQSFCLNWAVDTNDPFADILVYNGELWSYDALYQASQEPTIVDHGKRITGATFVDFDIDFGEEEDDDMTLTIIVEYSELVDLDGISVVLYGYADDYGDVYVEVDVTDFLKNTTPDADSLTVTYVFSIPADETEVLVIFAGFDVYANYTIKSVNKKVTDSYIGGV